MSHFRPIDRKTAHLLPPSVEEWLPEDLLARFIVEVVDGLDVSQLEQAYAGRGSAASHPALLLSLLVYGYAASGVRQLIPQLSDFVEGGFETLHYNSVSCWGATGFFTRSALRTSL